jgi:hypothetical protein
MTASAPRTAGRIFITYRREESAWPADRLFGLLEGRFGEGMVFRDVASIQPGDRFAEVINAAVARCDVLLALIGSRWSTATGKDGRQRLADPEDFVRLEIEGALRHDVRVIPVLIDGAQMPRRADLPPSLADLVKLQAFELALSHFDPDAEHLIRALEGFLAPQAPQPSATVRMPPSAEAGRKTARPWIRVRRWKLVSALLAVAAILAAVFIIISRPPSAPPQTAAETVAVQQASFSGGQAQSVSASCPAGTQMVGGGFSSDPYVAVYSSYPSGPSTWTIDGWNYGAPQSPVPIIAYATCVHADFSLGLMIASSAVTDVRSGTPANVIASCPASSTVLGGGPQSTYRGRPSQISSDVPIAFSSYPNLDRSSWTAGVAPGNLGASVRAYAICARSHVSAVNIVTGHLTVTGTESTTVQCETGQLLTQGGYYSDASDDRFKPVYSQPEGRPPVSWSFEARFAYLGSKIPPSATIYGICVRYS